MPSSYTPLLRLTLPADGELVGTWGQTVNNGITTLEEAAIAGTVTVATADANVTLSTANGATDQARYNTIRLTGALTAQRNVVCPSVSKNYFVRNDCTGGFAINFKTSAGTGRLVGMGSAVLLYCDGTNVEYAFDTFVGGKMVSDEAEPIALYASNAAIVWRLAGTEEPPGLVIERTGNILLLRGNGGVSIEDSTPGSAVQKFGASFSPQVASTASLGTSSLPWNDGWFSGEVGIGGTPASALFKLHAWHATPVIAASSTDGSGATTFIQANSSTDGRVGVTTNHKFAFVQNSLIRALIDTNGTLLVGGTNNSFFGAALECESATGRPQIAVKNSGAANYYLMNLSTAGNFDINNSSGTGVFLTLAGGGWTTISDERVKAGLTPIANAVAKVNALRAVTGYYVNDAAQNSRSFLIAQDVQAVLPEAVSEGDDSMLGLRYTEVIPLLVAAIKELDAKVAAL